jgi:hypothetical protein
MLEAFSWRRAAKLNARIACDGLAACLRQLQTCSFTIPLYATVKNGARELLRELLIRHQSRVERA